MLEIILDKHILFVLMGIVTVIGVVSKLIANAALKKLVRAAGNMSKSTHPFMRLLRAKFEHACMISDKVENVEVFVDKYLYEYKVAGLKLHTWRRLEKVAAWLCLILGVIGAVMEYAVHGMQDNVLKTGAAGAGLAILIYLLHLTTDENYRIHAAKNYIVDYLENVCMHRYEKVYHKELKVMAPEVPVPDVDKKLEEFTSGLKEEDTGKEQKPDKGKPIREPQRPRPEPEVPSPNFPPEIEPPTMPEPYDVPDVTPPIKAAQKQADKKTVQEDRRAAQMDRKESKTAGEAIKEERKEEPVPKEVLIRQILEEFMA